MNDQTLGLRFFVVCLSLPYAWITMAFAFVIPSGTKATYRFLIHAEPHDTPPTGFVSALGDVALRRAVGVFGDVATALGHCSDDGIIRLILTQRTKMR